MMDQLKQQSKKASEKLEGLSKQTQQEMDKMQKELEKTSKKAQKSLEKTGKQTKKSMDKAMKETKKSVGEAMKETRKSVGDAMKETRKSVDKAMEGTKEATASSGTSLLQSTKDAVYVDVSSKEKKVRLRRQKDSSDGDSDEEDGLLDDIGDEFDQLTLHQRLLSAIGCYVLSGLFAFAATVMLCTSVHHVRFYAFFYSLSNLATFSSLIFIMGQQRLQKRMLSRKRSAAGTAWIGALALTIVVAFVWPSHWFMVLMLLILQFGCMIWYSVSYYAFGRKFLHKYMAKRVVLVDAMDGKIDGK
ncbi:unnamed protein product [Hyaloperonospora brassicae]|uniref:Vesicle transport protein n=1 Tax=Hyaloperonospora brassicae TaxID=162125 RepID=A0AAV0V324_HYABA|nr:unnamed protein product [Hyaloperonospora brassicae]